MRRKAAALVAAVILAGCGAVDPYATVPRNAKPGQPAGDRVAICYNTMATTLAAVKADAQKECAAGTTAQQVDTDWYLQYCPLLLPSRATFVCAPKK
jgi:hypothetical protein